MPQFDDVRRRLRDSRSAIADADDRLLAIRGRLKQIAAREAALARVAAPRTPDPRLRSEGERLALERTAMEEEQERLLRARADLLGTEASLLTTFTAFTDPRRGITTLSDQTPILLMPLRLETRFKEVSVPTAAAPRHELWVRIYPDDCWIDTFDPTFSEDELRSVRTYWVDVWQAGRIEAQAQAAWRELVGKHGAGRAAWLVDQYQPLNAVAVAQHLDRLCQAGEQYVAFGFRQRLPQVEVSPCYQETNQQETNANKAQRAAHPRRIAA
jgi:hypothetical protein